MNDNQDKFTPEEHDEFNKLVVARKAIIAGTTDE